MEARRQREEEERRRLEEEQRKRQEQEQIDADRRLAVSIGGREGGVEDDWSCF